MRECEVHNCLIFLIAAMVTDVSTCLSAHCEQLPAVELICCSVRLKTESLTELDSKISSVYVGATVLYAPLSAPSL